MTLWALLGKAIVPWSGVAFPFFRSKVTSDHFRFVHSFRNKRRFSDFFFFFSEQFSLGSSESHRYPGGSKDYLKYSKGNTGFDLQERNCTNKRFSESVFVPDLCDPQEVGGSSRHPESQRVQSFHFVPTLQDGYSERHSSTVLSI